MADKGEVKEKANICDICFVCCSSAYQLCEHVMGHKHRTVAKRVSPESIPYLNKLQYFFDTYMKCEPLVGLEYVVEIQGKVKNRYKCLLCGFQGVRKPAFLHITGPEHITRYLDKHHPDLSVRENRHLKSEYAKALQGVTAEVCKIYGRKNIKETTNDGPSDLKTASKVACDKNGDLRSKSLRYLERKDDRCQKDLAEFKGNGEFLDYLQKFEIRNDEDARIIKRIAQNCTRALVTFQQEQQNEPRRAVSGPPASDNAYKTERGSSVLNVGGSSGRVDPAHTPVPQTDATQLFFNSIKNMELSEVVGVLHQIAATNPAFRGIDVPNVVRYLQATGRLKTS